MGRQHLFTVALRLKEVVEQTAQALAPLHRRGRLAQLLQMPVEAFQQARHRADQRSIEPADLVVRLDAGEGVARTHCVAQQHAPQAETPGVLFQILAQTQRLPLTRIQPPAHTGTLQPAAQGGQLILGDGEALTQRGDIQQIEYLANAEAAVRQAQQMLQCDDHRLLAAQSLIGQGEGNETRVVTGELAEHCLDMRCVGIDVRHHDDHVARP